MVAVTATDSYGLQRHHRMVTIMVIPTWTSRPISWAKPQSNTQREGYGSGGDVHGNVTLRGRRSNGVCRASTLETSLLTAAC